MEQFVIVGTELERRFQTAMSRGRAVLFSAPCGFGKTTTARQLLADKEVCVRSVGDPDYALPGAQEDWQILLVDDLQLLTELEDQQALAGLIREHPQRRFVLLTRGVMPSWLTPFQIAGVLTVFGAWDLALDRETTARLLRKYGVTCSDQELTEIWKVTKGCALALTLLARHLAAGETYDPRLADQVRLELFLYFEEAVLHRLDLPIQQLILELSPFPAFGPELARMVSGNSRAGELLGHLQRETTAMIQDRLDTYHFWPIFRRFLQWETEQTWSEEQRRALYARAALYYELNEDYRQALEYYAKSGDQDKISELLIKNAELHPGIGHYEEMASYYRALPEKQVLTSPALMQGMSMLEAIAMDYQCSEFWYGKLKEYADGRSRADGGGREARNRLAWLDIALPQRTVDSMVDTFRRLFVLLTNREIRLSSFSVTSNLPSLMNGGKDFSPWSKKDDLLYATLRVPVELVLGRDGVCLADCAIAESKFEKGEDIKDRILGLMANLERIRREGTPDLEFAVVGLLVRTQMALGRAEDARQTLEAQRTHFVETGEHRFLPNLDAMDCRIALRLGDEAAVKEWYREKAPRDSLHIHSMKRYQYLTRAMAELAMGDPGAALLTLAPLEPYFIACARYLDRIQLQLLRAVARYRLKDPAWRTELNTALDIAAEFQFIRPVSRFGSAVLPLLEDCGWTGKETLLRRWISASRELAACYPDFLRPWRETTAPLSAAELQVLRLICADKSNAEIGAILGIKVPTVKVHVSHILEKLNVSRRGEATTVARQLHLI